MTPLGTRPGPDTIVALYATMIEASALSFTGLPVGSAIPSPPPAAVTVHCSNVWSGAATTEFTVMDIGCFGRLNGSAAGYLNTLVRPATGNSSGAARSTCCAAVGT